MGALLCATSGAWAQELVTYYTTDAVGSVRMVTDASGGVLARYDYLPFGDLCGAACGPAAATDRRQFAGKEKDGETGLDYSGARYYASGAGRFTSPDPITGNELRLVSPQRWNQYAYAVNNPLNFGDPDGLDVIVFNFVNGAKGYGHLGIMAVNAQTGSAVYGGFNARHGGLVDSGKVASRVFPPGSIKFDNGRPTPESWAYIKEEVGQAEGRPDANLRAAYFPTAAAETASVERYISSRATSRSMYNVIGANCLTFCIQGLRSAGIDAPTPRTLAHSSPNIYFSVFLLELAFRASSPPITPRVSTSEAYCVPVAGECP
jgi:RHS repeat-associated protein